MPVAFAFDLDETLVDCEEHHNAATRGLLHALDLPPETARDAFHDVTGKRTRDILEAFREHSGVQHSLDEILALRHASFLTALDMAPPVPLAGAREALQEARALGPVALVTSGYRDDALATVEAAGLRPFFDVMVTGEDVLRPKPDPEPYLTAASRMGVRPADVVAFEDSHRGVDAARAAGCRIVAVPNPRTTRRELVGHADAVLGSLAEALPLAAFVERLQRRAR